MNTQASEDDKKQSLKCLKHNGNYLMAWVTQVLEVCAIRGGARTMSFGNVLRAPYSIRWQWHRNLWEENLIGTLST
jgi:hypothetical protein